MTAYPNMTREERGAEYTRVRQEFELWKAKGLKLNMARGKPGKQQLDLVSDIFSLMQDPQDYVSDGIDVRNYGAVSYTHLDVYKRQPQSTSRMVIGIILKRKSECKDLKNR